MLRNLFASRPLTVLVVCCGLTRSGYSQAVPSEQNPGPSSSSQISAPQSQTPSQPQAQNDEREITGSVKSGSTPLPGVAVSAANSLTGKKVFSSTDLEGSFKLILPSSGRYVVRAELAAFAPSTKEVILNAAAPRQRVEIELFLASRAQAAAQQQQAQAQQQINSLTGRGFQNLGVTQSEGAGNPDPAAGSSDSASAGLPPSMLGGDAATESVSVTGAQGRTENFGLSPDALQDRVQEFRDRAARGDFGGGGGGFGAGGGDFGGGGRQVFMIGGPGGGLGRFNVNQPHGAITYNLGESTLDAQAYSLNANNQPKSDYAQHRISGLIGGPLKIPHIYDGGTKTFYFVSYFGLISANPFDTFATVPTLAERSGDFSATRIRSGPNAGSIVQINNPLTGLPFPGNIIPQISPAAAGLLTFIPTPNLPGDILNFHRVTSSNSLTHNLNLRLTHNFGAGGGPGAGGGRRGGGARNNLNIGFNYRTGTSDTPNVSPLLGSTVSSGGLNLNVGYVRSFKKITNRFNFTINRSRIDNTNLYAGLQNVEGGLGINGVSTDPFDFGVPSLAFTTFTGVRDNSPLTRRDLTWSLSESASWNRGKHNVRFGGDFRRIHLNLRSSTNPRGSFIFTGLFTTAANKMPETANDFADFLLGLPQQTSIQFSSNEYHFLGNSWDLFVQDDWRILPKLTLNLGLRYEYVSPFSEANNRLVNLDASQNFTAVAAVFPGGLGPFTGVFPATLVNPDRNNFAPRIGIAWNVREKYVVRAGYGVSYNTGAWASFVQQLAFQPPFATTETNIATPALPLTLQNGLPVAASSTLTNNFGVDRNYRLGYVQTWNLDVQHQFSSSVVMNLDYTGTKGTRLDLQRAPDRGPTGLRIPNIEPFTWESSEADSILHAGSLRVRKRLQKGISFGGTYVYSKSIDNASTIGGGAVVVAQNDLDLAAERGLSSFDQRHRFTADYVVELPFGTNKRWLSGTGWRAKTLGDWTWSGAISLASGLPFTPRVLNDVRDVSQGTSGTLRADVTGQPVLLDNPSISEFFNTAAFVAPPPGQFGDARRNTISGPGTIQFDMSMGKNIPLKDTRAFEVRAQATNVFNHPNFTSIDTVVNSPTYGRVIGIGGMRRIQMMARFRF